MNPQEIADKIISLYSEKGQEEYGERVTMLQHMVQSARLAEQEGYDNEVILAAFLHDIGHFFDDEERMGAYGTQKHDQLGANFLREMGFSEKIATLVEGHVAAKRYLTFAEAGYYDKLSDASKATLEYQGGPMQAEEAANFKSSPLFELCLKMRIWDDLGKTDEVIGTEVLAYYRERIVDYLSRIVKK